MSTPTVYRFFDASDSLLYVGVTEGFEGRLSVHKATAKWWSSVSRIDLAHFATRKEAVAAERRAIRDENPRFNVQWKPQADAHPFKTLRQEALLTPEDLAVDAGLTPDAIYRYEAGDYKPRLGTALRLADALGVEVTDVIRCFVPAREHVRS